MLKISQAQYDAAVARLLGREKVADALSRQAAKVPGLMEAVGKRLNVPSGMATKGVLRSAMQGQAGVPYIHGRSPQVPLHLHRAAEQRLRTPAANPFTAAMQRNVAPVKSPGLLSRILGYAA